MFTSFVRNLGKYWLAVVGLAAAVAVSCLGLSGAGLMLNLARYPLTQVMSGEIAVLNKNMDFYGYAGGIRSGADDFQTFNFEAIAKVVKDTLPGAKITGTLWTPYLSADGSRSDVLIAKWDDTGNPLYLPELVDGAMPAFTGTDRQVLAPDIKYGSRYGGFGYESPGSTLSLRLPAFSQKDGKDQWDLVGGKVFQYTVSGTYKTIMDPRYYLPLKTVQEQTGAIGLVNWLGVSCPDPIKVDEAARDLNQALNEKGLPLKALTVDYFSEMMVADFARFKRTSAFYAPVMTLISVTIVLATALAMAFNRRRELALLAVIGLSSSQVRGLFVSECAAVAFAGCVAGQALSALGAGTMFRSSVVSLVPAASTFALTLLVAFLSSPSIGKGRVQDILRNP